jgi:hypothetical protein
MESTKTIQLKIKDVNFYLVEKMVKCANGINYVSSVVCDNKESFQLENYNLWFMLISEETSV